MGCRKHHYVYTQGYFFCTKCGRRRYSGTHRSRKRIKKVGTGIGIFTAIAVLAFVVYSYSEQVSNITEQVKQTIEDVPAQIPATPLDEPIKSAEEKTKEIIKSITEAVTLDTELTAQKIHDLVNEQRELHYQKPLSWNPKISQASVNHSQDMANRDYFSHDSPEGRDFTWRYAKVGFECNMGGGENIFYLEGYYGEDAIAKTVVGGWMESKGHRENILRPYFTNEGIGVAVSESGTVYVTEDFC